MVFGLYSIASTFAGEYVTAAWMILVCVLIDKLDGSLARLLNASSKFGVELDSFSDFLTFCVAPGLLYMGLVTNDARYTGWWGQGAGLTFVKFACAFFIVMGGLRLAKFNVLTEEIGGKIFLGIPTTLCGGINACWALTVWKYDLPHACIAAYPIVLVVLGLWMVSNIPLPKVGKTSSTPFNVFLAVNAVAIYILIPLQLYPEYLLALALIWAFVGTGLAWFVWHARKPVPEDSRERLMSMLGAPGDNRNTTLDPEGMVLAGAELLDLMQDDRPEFDAVAGAAGDPLVGGVVVASHERKTPVPGVTIEANDGGEVARGRGVADGARIAMVEDAIGDGSRALDRLAALRQAGFEVVQLVALFDGEEGGLERVASEGVPAAALFRKTDFAAS